MRGYVFVLAAVSLMSWAQFGLADDFEPETSDASASAVSAGGDTESLTEPLHVDAIKLADDEAFRNDEDAPSIAVDSGANFRSKAVEAIVVDPEHKRQTVDEDYANADKYEYVDDAALKGSAHNSSADEGRSDQRDANYTAWGSRSAGVFGTIVDHVESNPDSMMISVDWRRNVQPDEVYGPTTEFIPGQVNHHTDHYPTTSSDAADGHTDAGTIYSPLQQRRTQQTSVESDGQSPTSGPLQPNPSDEPSSADPGAQSAGGDDGDRRSAVGNHKWMNVVGLMGHHRRSWDYYPRKHHRIISPFHRKNHKIKSLKSRSRSAAYRRDKIYGSIIKTENHSHHHNQPQHHHHHHHHHHQQHHGYVHKQYQSWPDRKWSQYSAAPVPRVLSTDTYVPPYIKKFNRRNKQLLDLLEGTEAPPAVTTKLRQVYYAKVRAVHHKHHKKHQNTKDQWMEANLFEEQRPKATRNYTIRAKPSANELPDLNTPVRAEILDSDEIVFSSDIRDSSLRDNSANYNSSAPMNASTISETVAATSRLNHFQFHRVASPRLIGAGSYGLLRKQRLPFVAITDRRLNHPGATMHNNHAQLAH